MKIKVELIVELDAEDNTDIAKAGDRIAALISYLPLSNESQSLIARTGKVTCTRVETHN